MSEAWRPEYVVTAKVARTGHEAVELAIAHFFLPPSARATLAAEYGGIDEYVDALARARAMSTAVAIAAYAWNTGDRALLQEGLVAMHHVLI